MLMCVYIYIQYIAQKPFAFNAYVHRLQIGQPMNTEN